MRREGAAAFGGAGFVTVGPVCGSAVVCFSSGRPSCSAGRSRSAGPLSFEGTSASAAGGGVVRREGATAFGGAGFVTVGPGLWVRGCAPLVRRGPLSSPKGRQRPTVGEGRGRGKVLRPLRGRGSWRPGPWIGGCVPNYPPLLWRDLGLGWWGRGGRWGGAAAPSVREWVLSWPYG